VPRRPTPAHAAAPPSPRRGATAAPRQRRCRRPPRPRPRPHPRPPAWLQTAHAPVCVKTQAQAVNSTELHCRHLSQAACISALLRLSQPATHALRCHAPHQTPSALCLASASRSASARCTAAMQAPPARPPQAGAPGSAERSTRIRRCTRAALKKKRSAGMLNCARSAGSVGCGYCATCRPRSRGGSGMPQGVAISACLRLSVCSAQGQHRHHHNAMCAWSCLLCRRHTHGFLTRWGPCVPGPRQERRECRAHHSLNRVASGSEPAAAPVCVISTTWRLYTDPADPCRQLMWLGRARGAPAAVLQCHTAPAAG